MSQCRALVKEETERCPHEGTHILRVKATDEQILICFRHATLYLAGREISYAPEVRA